jgi:hypothetical protein
MIEKSKNDDRVVHVYKIPGKLYTDGVGRSFGLVELSGKMDRRARSRAKFKLETLQEELTKESIVEIDGRDVTALRHEVDKFWDELPGRARSLVHQAHNKHNSLEDDEVDSFLATCETKIG